MCRICTIYKIKNIITNQIYIGSSINIRSRIRRHFKELKDGKHHSLKLQRSYDKYGKENFIVEYLVTVPEEYRQKMEQWFLDNNDCYFNNEKIVGKPSINRVYSEEDREKIRRRMLGNTYHLLSNGLTDEGRKKLAEAAENRIWTEESRKKLSNSKIGNKSLTGLLHTEDTKNKMSLNSHNKRKISQFNTDGSFVTEWESISEVVKKLNYCSSSISNCCRGKIKTSYGFIWRYEEDVRHSNSVEPIDTTNRKYNYDAIILEYENGKTRKEIMDMFGISSTGLMAYILSKK